MPYADPTKHREAMRERGRRYRERHREAFNAREKARYRAFQERLASFKAAGCVDCGTTEGPLDFDHRPGTCKLFEISQVKSRPWAEVVAEIAKCDVRCRPCHAKRHYGKLTDSQVLEIRTRCGRGETQASLAREFGVAPSYVSQMVHFKRRRS